MLASMSPSSQFVIGTRYGKGVEMDKDWPLYRRIISSGARLLALPLTSASDPMSGFFGIRKESVSARRNQNTKGTFFLLIIFLRAVI